MTARTRTITIATAATLGAGAALVPAGGAVAAGHLECGEHIYASTVLTTDLVCSSGDGLVIAADDVVLDLGGHTITGPGTWIPGAGVRSAGNAGVEIRNGTITGFSEGVVLDESSSHLVTMITAHRNDIGINLAGGGDHVVEKNIATSSNRDGIRLGLSTDNVIAKNTLADNTWGVSVADSSADNLVAKNVARGNRANGIAVFAGATGTTVEKNEVFASWGNGIQLNGDTSASRVVKNYAHGNGGDGIHVAATATTVTKNIAVENGDYGIEAVPGVTDGGKNQAAGNGNPAQCTGVTCGPVT